MIYDLFLQRKLWNEKIDMSGEEELFIFVFSFIRFENRKENDC